MAFNQPARQSLVPRLVPPDVLLNALSLNTSGVNIMRVLGASLAGVLLIFFNYGEVYLINVIVFVFVIWTTSKIKVDEGALETEGRKPQEKALWSDLIDGFRYVSRNPALLYLVGLGLLLFILGMPYQQVFIPLLAIDVLHIGRSGAGWMLALTGVGALVGSLTIASIRQLRRRGPLLMGFLLSLGASLVLLAQSRWFPLSILALIIIGASTAAYMASSNSLLLEQSSREYHGRVMSLMSLDRGLVSIGSVIAGALAEGLGPQLGLTILSLVCLAFTVLIFVTVRPLRQIS
jgi:MFS family permease